MSLVAMVLSIAAAAADPAPSSELLRGVLPPDPHAAALVTFARAEEDSALANARAAYGLSSSTWLALDGHDFRDDGVDFSVPGTRECSTPSKIKRGWVRGTIEAFIAAHPRNDDDVRALCAKEGSTCGPRTVRPVDLGFGCVMGKKTVGVVVGAHWDEGFGSDYGPRRSESAIFVVTGAKVRVVERNGAAGAYDEPLDRWPELLAVADVDGDRDLDLVIEHVIRIGRPGASDDHFFYERTEKVVAFTEGVSEQISSVSPGEYEPPALPFVVDGKCGVFVALDTTSHLELSEGVHAFRGDGGKLVADDALAKRLVDRTTRARALYFAAARLEGAVRECLEQPRSRPSKVADLRPAAVLRSEIETALAKLNALDMLREDANALVCAH